MRVFLAIAVALWILGGAAWAQSTPQGKGVVYSVRETASGVTEITYKDYRPRARSRPRASTPGFREYDLSAPAGFVTPQTEAVTSYQVHSDGTVRQTTSYRSSSYPPSTYPPSDYQRSTSPSSGYPQGGGTQTYTQVYEPGPNTSMARGGGGGALSPTTITYSLTPPWYCGGSLGFNYPFTAPYPSWPYYYPSYHGPRTPSFVPVLVPSVPFCRRGGATVIIRLR
ncbi:MAG TPA: hypothetical protein VNO81_11900 [Candidatus Nitrosotenuis sp.]|jgi:hypothetical protein|nr:hypothetical protein [Candidatus Nitrosotenuis sp.]